MNNAHPFPFIGYTRFSTGNSNCGQLFFTNFGVTTQDLTELEKRVDHTSPTLLYTPSGLVNEVVSDMI
jgi:hypothetical protein